MAWLEKWSKQVIAITAPEYGFGMSRGAVMAEGEMQILRLILSAIAAAGVFGAMLRLVRRGCPP